FFSSRRRHTRSKRDWSSDVCSSDLRFIDENRQETIRILLQWVKQTPEIAARSYDLELKTIRKDGQMTDAEMESFLERLGDKKRPLDEVRDFSLVRQTLKELEANK